MGTKIILGVAGVLAAGFFLAAASKDGPPEKQAHVNSHGAVHELVAYKSPTCGCCGNWVAYMKGKGYKVDVVEVEDVESVKRQHDIPKDLYSCHTTVVNGGEYFIEGHIPEESIARLLEETPDISGIGMPGMPSGSPGMPGAKEGLFEIVQVDKLQKMNLFESI